ncbi:VanZ family protein [Leptolyngbya sp. AN02str]|uniref:VanZ family protein n=1 Tax=Leptolyngbya sp. AN02str TaxID=3423363 RepID=UPI003D311E1D
MDKVKAGPWRSRLAAVTFAGFFLWILILAYQGNLPPQLEQFPNHDKLGHVVLYGLGAFLGHRVLHRHRVRLGPWVLPWWILAFSTFTVVEELIQSQSPHRSLDALDLVCSGVGIWLGYWLAERSLR